MLRRFARAIPSLGLVLVLAATSCFSPATSGNVVQKDEVIAGSPKDSLEVRQLVLRGTNEQIGRALAELAKERYAIQLDPAKDPLQVRAQRKFLERNYPILLERMRGVADAFGKSIDDDAWDFTSLGYTDLRAGCSVAHLPPASTANGKSVVSRDYDFSTGSLSFGALPPGMLHPTARPYLLELHPDRGYASIAMTSYDLLSGVLDGINSEGLTVTLAMDDQLFSKFPVEPTREPAVGLSELQTLRMLLDTCATVDEAKQALRSTKQYYQYVPVHYLIADRTGRAFVWEYSESHNQEYVIESPGQPLVMTNFTLHKQLEDGKPPSPDKARGTCKRYAYLREKLAAGNLDDAAIRGFHQNVDAQMSQAADPSRPPIRTFWHAFYYPEDRRVRLSYYLRDEPYPDDARLVHPIRSDYLEFRLEPTGGKLVAKEKSTGVQATLEAAGAVVDRNGTRIVGVGLEKVTALDAVMPLLAKLPDLETLNFGNPGVTPAHVAALRGMAKLHSLGLAGAPIGDEALEVMKTLPALRVLSIAGTKVTDAGLADLAGLTRLEYLNLSNDDVTDAGLAQLGRMPSLGGLNLSGTKITDAGLVLLKELPKLTKLNVTGTAVTDQGVKDAKKFLPVWATITRS